MVGTLPSLEGCIADTKCFNLSGVDLQNKEQNVQVSDTRDDDNSTQADKPKSN